MQRYAVARSAAACRTYSTQSAVRVVPRPRDSTFMTHRRDYEKEVSELRREWRQEYLDKVAREEEIRRAKAGEEALYVVAYRAEREKAREQRRIEMLEKLQATRAERKAVREAYREHKARLEAKARAKHIELVNKQRDERQAFVVEGDIGNRIRNALIMPPVSTNKPLPTKR